MADIIDPRELIRLLRDRDSATNRLLTAWADVPMLLMLEEDWEAYVRSDIPKAEAIARTASALTVR